MALFKTFRCRYFDDSGHPIKPYCTQGPHCRFIHPDDLQWNQADNRLIPSERYDKAEPYRKHRHDDFSSSRSHPMSTTVVPEGEPFADKRFDEERDRKQSRKAYERHDFRSWERHVRAHEVPPREVSDRRSYSNSRSKDARNKPTKFVSGWSTAKQERVKEGTHTDDWHRSISGLSSRPDTTERASRLFHRLIRLCTELVQDTCTLAMEEDRLKAFADLSVELSRVSHHSATAVVPTLADVTASHRKSKERADQHAKELESLWESLFSAFKKDIVNVIESRLKSALATLQEEEGNLLHSIAKSRPVKRKAEDPVIGTSDRAIGSLEWGAASRDTSLVAGDLSIAKRRRTEAPKAGYGDGCEDGQEIGLRELLERMKSQMDKQTRAIERLVKENHQEENTSQHIHLLGHMDPSESSRQEL